MARQLLVESIRIDGRTQSRVRINEETVAEYAEAMKVPGVWPALTVFFDGKEYWLADGFHRLLAAQRIGRKHVTADVKQGSRQDAAWASCGANQTHGLRRTNADKRKVVEIALKLHPEKSDRIIAGHCGLSHPFVSEIRRQVVTVTTSTRTGADGKQYPVSAKGAAAQGNKSSTRAEHGAGLGPPPGPDERPGAKGTAPEAEPADGKADRKPEYPVDDMGRRIPDHLLELWERRREVQELLTAVSRVRVALHKAQDSGDPLFSEIPFSSAIVHLDQAYDALQVAKPYAVCPMCQGRGCKTCGQRGLLGKFRWDNTVPKEHKEAVARIIEKERSA